MITFKQATKDNPNMILFPSTSEENIGFFTEERVDKSTVPEGWQVYEFRTNNYGRRSTIEPKVAVNFGGSFVTETPITFPDENDKYRNIKGKVKKIKQCK